MAEFSMNAACISTSSALQRVTLGLGPSGLARKNFLYFGGIWTGCGNKSFTNNCFHVPSTLRTPPERG